MAKRNYKDWLQKFLENTEHYEAPQRLRFWTGVATIAGALKRNVWFDMGGFSFKPNFYIVLVAPAAVARKSTSMDLGMKLLQELPKVNFGPSTGSWQGMLKKLIDSEEMTPMSDDTYLTQSSITVQANELGSFLNGRDYAQQDILTDLYDGKDSFQKTTLTMGDETVSCPALNLIACVTPSWIGKNLSSDFYEWGLASRIIFVYADTPAHDVPYPYKNQKENESEVNEKLIEDLEMINELRGGFKLSGDAEKWGEEWYSKHRKTLLEGGYSHLHGDKFMGYLGRKHMHLHKLAMVLSAARRDEKVITVDEMKDALRHLHDMELYLPQVYEGFHKNTEMIMAEDIKRTIHQAGNKITKKRLYRQYMDRMHYESFEKLMGDLQSAGYIAYQQSGNSTYVKLKVDLDDEDN